MRVFLRNVGLSYRVVRIYGGHLHDPRALTNTFAGGSCRSKARFRTCRGSRCMAIPFPPEMWAAIFLSTSILRSATTSTRALQRAVQLAKEFLEKLPANAAPRNSVDDHVLWLRKQPGFTPESRRISEGKKFGASAGCRRFEGLYTTAGVLLVDAEGHGIIAAKIASTVHDTFQALMLSELDHRGKTTPEFFERLNLAAGAIGDGAQRAGKKPGREYARDCDDALRRSAPVRTFSLRQFRASAATRFFGGVSQVHGHRPSRMVQFLALGVQIPEDHPDRKSICRSISASAE